MEVFLYQNNINNGTGIKFYRSSRDNFYRDSNQFCPMDNHHIPNRMYLLTLER